MFGSSGILQTQYTETSSIYIYTDFTLDSVARLHNRREDYGVILELGTTADWRDMVFVRGTPACVNRVISQ